MFAKLLDNVHVALYALGQNKTRAFLTMLGITIGVASVILLMSVGEAFESFVLHEFSQYGSDLVITFGKLDSEAQHTNEMDEMAQMFEPLTQEDLDALRNPFNVPDALVVAAEVAVDAELTYRGETYDPIIGGMTANYLDAYEFHVAVGERFTEAHMNSAARVAILGQDVVTEVFDGANPIGATVRIGDVGFRVIGVFEDIQSSFAPEANNFVILPITTVQQRLTKERTPSGDYPVLAISVKAVDPSAVDDVVRDVRATLRETHNLEPSDSDDFIIFSQNQLLDTLDTITSLITMFLATIGGISLIVGGIGIMNIMLVSVIERTREIGIRKAVGAQRVDILLQFLVEAATLSFVGGFIGILIATLSCVAVSALVPNLSVVVSAASILLATGISISLGIFFGIYPANRAANLNPIDALRFE